jgi:hypothetical protein
MGFQRFQHSGFVCEKVNVSVYISNPHFLFFIADLAFLKEGNTILLLVFWHQASSKIQLCPSSP